jgi:hypothetical protein
MSAFEIARAIRDMEASADLLIQAAEALSAWDNNYNPERELDTARELHYRALSLRVLLEVERREKVLH